MEWPKLRDESVANDIHRAENKGFNQALIACERLYAIEIRQPTGIEPDNKTIAKLKEYEEKRYGTPKERLVELDENKLWMFLRSFGTEKGNQMSLQDCAKAICQRFGARPDHSNGNA